MLIDLAEGDELADVGHGGAGTDQLNDPAELHARSRPRADGLLFTYDNILGRNLQRRLDVPMATTMPPLRHACTASIIVPLRAHIVDDDIELADPLQGRREETFARWIDRVLCVFYLCQCHQALCRLWHKPRSRCCRRLEPHRSIPLMVAPR